MGVGEDVDRLAVATGLHQRLAVGAEDEGVARVAQGRLLQHRGGLGRLVVRPEGAGIRKGRASVARIGVEAFGQPVEILA